jgi:hypothetical protein
LKTRLRSQTRIAWWLSKSICDVRPPPLCRRSRSNTTWYSRRLRHNSSVLQLFPLHLSWTCFREAPKKRHLEHLLVVISVRDSFTDTMSCSESDVAGFDSASGRAYNPRCKFTIPSAFPQSSPKFQDTKSTLRHRHKSISVEQQGGDRYLNRGTLKRGNKRGRFRLKLARIPGCFMASKPSRTWTR